MRKQRTGHGTMSSFQEGAVRKSMPDGCSYAGYPLQVPGYQRGNCFEPAGFEKGPVLFEIPCGSEGPVASPSPQYWRHPRESGPRISKAVDPSDPTCRHVSRGWRKTSLRPMLWLETTSHRLSRITGTQLSSAKGHGARQTKGPKQDDSSSPSLPLSLVCESVVWMCGCVDVRG